MIRKYEKQKTFVFFKHIPRENFAHPLLYSITTQKK